MQMVVFKRTIGNFDITVYIQSNLYESENALFNCIFNSFIYLGECTNYTKGLYITNNIDEIDLFESVLYCDRSELYWVYRLIVSLEDYFVRYLGSTVLHASCVKIKDKVLLLPGSRMSGKSTIAKYFIETLQADFLADDFVFIVDDKIYGFRFPISMRSESISSHSRFITLDFDNKTRYLYHIPGNLIHCNSVDIVLFPQYKQNSFSLEYIDKSTAFNKMITNVKFFKSKKKLFYDINKLISSTCTYQAEYDNFNHLDEIIYHIFD